MQSEMRKMSEQEETVRKILTLPTWLLLRIEEYRATLRPIPSEAEAIRRLIMKGLEAEAKKGRP
jgi:hypothetical protein